jgi:hypothetical protein
MRRTLLAAAALAGALTTAAALSAAAQNADKPVANLRLATDTSGTPMQPESEPPEKIYRLPNGTAEVLIAYDFQGTEPTNVSVRVMGPNGTIEFQDQQKVDKPGLHIVSYKPSTGSIAENEYVINAYVGEQQYLADSLQLAVGAAKIVGSATPAPQETAEATPAGPGAAVPTPPGPGEPPAPGADPAILVLAGLGLLVLAGIVVWAVRSAMSSGKA